MLLFLKTKAHVLQLNEVKAWWEETTLLLSCAWARWGKPQVSPAPLIPSASQSKLCVPLYPPQALTHCLTTVHHKDQPHLKHLLLSHHLYPSCTQLHPRICQEATIILQLDFKVNKELCTWSSKSYLSALSWSFCPILQHAERPMVLPEESGDRGKIFKKLFSTLSLPGHG